MFIYIILYARLAVLLFFCSKVSFLYWSDKLIDCPMQWGSKGATNRLAWTSNFLQGRRPPRVLGYIQYGPLSSWLVHFQALDFEYVNLDPRAINCSTLILQLLKSSSLFLQL